MIKYLWSPTRLEWVRLWGHALDQGGTGIEKKYLGSIFFISAIPRLNQPTTHYIIRNITIYGQGRSTSNLLSLPRRFARLTSPILRYRVEIETWNMILKIDSQFPSWEFRKNSTILPTLSHKHAGDIEQLLDSVGPLVHHTDKYSTYPMQRPFVSAWTTQLNRLQSD